MKNIPLNRLILYGLFLGLIPLVFVLFSYLSKKAAIEDLNSSIEYLQQQSLVKEKKQSLNLAVREHFKDADHFYIDKRLETLNFLEEETELLQKMTADKSFASDERVKKRLEFLTGSDEHSGNHLVFSEGVVQKFPLFQETVETLMHPVEINAKDLQKILVGIEGVNIGEIEPFPNRPQLNLKLVKREFL